MTATNQIQSSSKALGTYPSDYSGASKSLSNPKALTKDLGADPALAAWYEEAYAYLMSGNASPQESAQLTEWLNWAAQQLGMVGGSQFGDPMMGGQPMGPQPQPLPPGAIPGANGNAVFDQMDANIEHTAYGQPIDVYSNNIVLNSGSMMTTFTCEVATDTRLNPAEQVLKITASDGTVYFVHDYEDANIVIKTPVEDMVNTGGQPNVSWEQFSGAEGGASAAGLTGGEVEKVDETHSTVTAGAGEVIDATPNKNVDETQFYTVYGELNVSLPADCTADITQVEGNTVVTVKDRDGKVIAEYTVISGFPVNVNHANEKSITINGNPVKMGEDKDGNEVVENGWEGLSINGVADDGSKTIFGTIKIPAGLGVLGGDPEAKAGTDSEAALQAIAAATGQPYDKSFFDKLFQFYPDLLAFDANKDYVLDATELAEAAKAGHTFPPAEPNGTFLGFLGALDPTLLAAMGDLADAIKMENLLGFPQVPDSLYQNVRDRIVALLQTIYAGKEHVFAAEGGGKNADNIVFGNKTIDIIDQDHPDTFFHWVAD